MTDDNHEHTEAIEKDVVDGEVVEDKGGAPAIAEQVLPETLHIIPIPSRPFFPGQLQPVGLDPEEWSSTLEALNETGHDFVGASFSGPGKGDDLDVEQLPGIGCVVRLHKPPLDDDEIEAGRFLAQGITRFRVVRWLSKEMPYLAQVEYPDTKGERDTTEVKAYAMALLKAVKELLPLNPLYSAEIRHSFANFNTSRPDLLADFAAALTSADGKELQQVIEALSLLPRMEIVLKLLQKEREVAELHSEISEQVNEKLSDQQRQFFLREQLKIIQKELGISRDDRSSDVETFTKRMQRWEPSDAVSKRFSEELDKLSVLQSGSPEYGVTRNYLDWASAVPWGFFSKDNLELTHAKQVLSDDHEGLEDVKARILEFIAVGKFRGEIAGSILLLVGPPGVGKTSIGKSVARALGRKFYRFSVGGMRDEAEIKGHRRTYVGAMPGKLVQALKEVEVSNPVIMLDEIDKMGASYQGDPASAMLEVLDPEQNQHFLDHYLDLRLDLSKVVFVCTANQLDTIPGPLLDRMEVIRLSGYVAQEKLAIAVNHLWPRQLERHGLSNAQLKINEPALRYVIDGYCREAGVRQLDKQLARIARKSIVKMLDDDTTKVRVGKKDIENLLGKPRFTPERPMRGVGVATGLAWTRLGGATLAIESSRIHTLHRGFKLTGKLGDVMRESADIAYSYVVSHLRDYGCDLDFFDKSMVHLHVPEGATPKDGPSAGITMATALISLARKERIKQPLAMTGELTLTGQVLPVGGIREKVIAARRSKITELILPAANKRDFDELPSYLQEGLQVHFAKTYRDVFDCIFNQERNQGSLH